MTLSMAVPAVAREKKKAVAKTATASMRLSYNDQRRFNYFFLEAVRQQNAGHYAAAFDLLNHCLQIDSMAAEAYFMRARYLSTLRQDSLALADLERAALLRTENDTYQEQVASYYIGMGNYDKALDAYEQLYASHRDRSDVLNILIQLYRQQKQYPKMLSAIERLEQVEGETEQTAMAKMNVYQVMGDTKRAYKVLKDLADSHPNDLNFSVMFGNWLMQNRKQKEAYKLFDGVLRLEPDNAYAQSAMYDYYKAVGQQFLAKQMMDRILLGKNTPADSRAQFFRMAIQENEQEGGDSTKIVDLIGRMQQVAPADSSLAEMKVAYYTMKKMPQAMVDSALVDLLKLTPDNAGARLQLIQNKWSTQNWKEIAALSEPGMLYNPDEMAFYYFTGLVRYYQKDDTGAIDALRRGTAEINDNSNPDLVSDLYAMMGEIYHSMGQKSECFAAYDSCLQWKPDNMMTLNNYAYFLTLEGKDLKRAEEMSAKTVKAEPKNATFLDTYAWVLFRQNRYAEAKLYIDQALVNDTDTTINADVLEHAADIYQMNGDAKAALGYLQRAIDAGGDKVALMRKMDKYRKPEKKRK